MPMAEQMVTYADPEPMDGDEWQVARGFGHCNQQINELAQEVFRASTEIGAVATLLQERGLISLDELKERRTAVAKRLQDVFQQKQIGVQIDDRIPDKYAIPPEKLPAIDCEARIPLCRAACCSMRFALSAQDLDEGVMRWELGQPYRNRVGPDTRCVHQHRQTFGCTIYAQRPAVCRVYDCRNDRRIWVDFERREINPSLFTTLDNGELIPTFDDATRDEPRGSGKPDAM